MCHDGGSHIHTYMSAHLSSRKIKIDVENPSFVDSFPRETTGFPHLFGAVYPRRARFQATIQQPLFSGCARCYEQHGCQCGVRRGR